jgi:CHASE3 domain sensor protein
LIWRQQQINNRCKHLAVILFVFLAFGSCLYSGHYVFAQTDQTASKLQAANSAVEQAFNAVLDAEKAGANVTGLLGQLNVAAGVLAQAENSYRTGDSNTAAVQADSVLPIAQEVTTAAQDAKQTALVSGQNAFWSTIAFTVIGAFVFVLALFLVWRRFKRSYINSLSEAKPEVNSQ